jgi:hypothetical protein
VNCSDSWLQSTQLLGYIGCRADESERVCVGCVSVPRLTVSANRINQRGDGLHKWSPRLRIETASGMEVVSERLKDERIHSKAIVPNALAVVDEGGDARSRVAPAIRGEQGTRSKPGRMSVSGDGHEVVSGVAVLLAAALWGVCALLTPAARAQREEEQRGNLIVEVGGGIVPSRLPRLKRAPVQVLMEASIRSADRSLPPELKQLVLEINRHGHLRTDHLPTCSLAELESVSAGCAARDEQSRSLRSRR